MRVPPFSRALRAVPQGWDILLALVAVVAIFALSSTIAFRNTQALNEASRGLLDTHDLVSSLDETLLLMSEAESAERAFLITGDELFLLPYREATEKLKAQMPKLERLAESEPSLSEQLPGWRERIAARQRQLEHAIALRRTEDLDAAREIVLASRERGEMAAFKAEVQALEQAKHEVRNAREQEMLAAYRTALLGGGLATLLGLILIAALAGYAWRYRQVRQQIYRERELLRATLLSIGEGVITTDAKARVSMINRCAQQLTGWNEEQARGRALTEVFRVMHEATHQAHDNPALAAIRDGEPAQLSADSVLASREDKTYPVEATAAPVKDTHGVVLGAVLVFRDITRQRQGELALRESEHQAQERAGELEALMESMPAAIWIAHDARCERITGNAASYRLLQLPMGMNVSPGAGHPLPVKAYHRLEAHEALAPSELPLQRAIAQGHQLDNLELCLKFEDGTHRYILGNCAPLKNAGGTVRGAIGAFIDVTDYKNIEAQLKEADRRKDEFLAILAHELRNPLAPLRSGVTILHKVDDALTVSRTLVMMERQLGHMVRLIDDLLDVSRITGGKIALRKELVPLHVVLEQAIEASRPVMNAAGHTFELDLCSEQVWVNVDINRLCQVVSNLLTNAAKYTPEGGRIILAVDREPRWARIRVVDNGLGIPPPVLGDVFTMFTQVNRTLHRAQGGLGVGLSLVKSLVEKHGGSVVAHSEGLGRGSTFTVRLPLQTPAAIPHEAEPAMGTTTEKALRILVVDDNRDAADSLAILLTAAGHEIRVAYSACEAIEAIRSFVPQVAFLDIGMPHVSGYELAAKLRAETSLTDTRLVALTGWGEEADRLRSYAAGFDMHITKPIDLETLNTILTDVDGMHIPQS